MAMVLLRLGCRHALVVHGEDGLDEISIAAPSQIWELKDGNIYNFAVTPEDLGLSRASASDVQGQSIEDNLAAMNRVLSGESRAGQGHSAAQRLRRAGCRQRRR